MDRELLQDSDAVNESFWDGLGVEFEAKYIFDFRSAPRGGPGSARDGGTEGAPGRGDTGGPRRCGAYGGYPPMKRYRVSPRPGAHRVPPSRAPPGLPVPRRPRPTGRALKVKKVFCFKLDAKSVPEALAASIRILLRFSIDLAHR